MKNLVLKLVLLTVVALFLKGGLHLMGVMLHPEVSTELALEQFADPSFETDTTMRTYNALGGITMMVWLVYFVAVFFTLKDEVISLFTLKSEEDS